jgi:hypothetical protein
MSGDRLVLLQAVDTRRPADKTSTSEGQKFHFNTIFLLGYSVQTLIFCPAFRKLGAITPSVLMPSCTWGASGGIYQSSAERFLD